MITATDFNKQNSTYTDSFERLKTASFPDGGSTSFNYRDTPGAFSASETQLQSTTTGDSVVTTVNYDGLVE